MRVLPFCELFHCAVDLLFGEGVEVGCCFVKNDDWGILQDCAGYGYALPFSSAELHAVLSGEFVEAAFEMADASALKG